MPDRTAKDTAAPHKANARTRVLLVTGMSGAGKSTALKVFEDLGYEAVDNIPLSLLKILLAPAGDGAAPRHGARRAPLLHHLAVKREAGGFLDADVDELAGEAGILQTCGFQEAGQTGIGVLLAVA